MNLRNCWGLALAGSMLLTGLGMVPAYGQDGTATGASVNAVSTNNMSLQSTVFLCGGKAQAGTPIGGNGTSTTAGTTGTITISGIPVTASVLKATLFWSILTSSTSSTAGAAITFASTGILGTNIGKAPESPCFPQAATVAYKADVTALVPSPGNGAYSLSGFPTNPDYAEGATLQVLWSDPNGALKEDVLYHTTTNGLLAVTLGEAFSQSLTGFTTNAAGPVTATLYEVIGNGQTNGNENLRFDGPCAGDVNLDNTLDGSTVAKAANTCLESIGTHSTNTQTECFWDDDVQNVSAQYACGAGNGATTGALTSSGGPDCFDWDALNLLVSTDNATVAAACGAAVDIQCPTGAAYNNHGDYVSCVAHAAETFLVGLPLGGTCPRAEIQSACVNPRARSQVGK